MKAPDMAETVMCWPCAYARSKGAHLLHCDCQCHKAAEPPK